MNALRSLALLIAFICVSSSSCVLSQTHDVARFDCVLTRSL